METEEFLLMYKSEEPVSKEKGYALFCQKAYQTASTYFKDVITCDPNDAEIY